MLLPDDSGKTSYYLILQSVKLMLDLVEFWSVSAAELIGIGILGV